MGEGGAGKTTLVDALCNKPYEKTASTVGIATKILETHALRNWVEVKGTEGNKVVQVSIVEACGTAVFTLSFVGNLSYFSCIMGTGYCSPGCSIAKNRT